MRGAPWKTFGVLALFSPAAWRATGRTAREAVIVVRNVTLFAAVTVSAFTYWWQRQEPAVQITVVAAFTALLVMWVRRKTGRTAIPHRRTHRPPGASQVLYRWWERDDLPDGLRCSCGKPRRAGELVYVGITGAHRSRELDDDRRAACWWNVDPPVVGTQELYRTRPQVEYAEVVAIRSEGPRENRQHSPW